MATFMTEALHLVHDVQNLNCLWPGGRTHIQTQTHTDTQPACMAKQL